MPPSPKDFLPDAGDDDSRSGARTRALVTGSVALGALVTGAVLEKARHRKYPPSARLPEAVEADLRQLEIMEGVTRFYHRPGKGTPVVLLHSINAAGSSFEMKPVFDYFAGSTGRPIYAIDWLGFGKSDRPPVAYAPGLYQRQLRRILSECVGEPADVVAYSLACEYAATVANAFPFLFRRLVLIAPTALSRSGEGPRLQKTLVSAVGRAGMFELIFSRLSSREALRSFYARNIFSASASVPDDLVDYAFLTTHIRGAHFAPRRFIQGSLFMGDYATRGYQSLSTPTLLIVPEHTAGTVQQFERTNEVVGANASVRVERIASGLMPMWEKPEEIGTLLDEFLATAGSVPASQVEV